MGPPTPSHTPMPQPLLGSPFHPGLLVLGGGGGGDTQSLPAVMGTGAWRLLRLPVLTLFCPQV